MSYNPLSNQASIFFGDLNKNGLPNSIFFIVYFVTCNYANVIGSNNNKQNNIINHNNISFNNDVFISENNTASIRQYIIGNFP